MDISFDVWRFCNTFEALVPRFASFAVIFLEVYISWLLNQMSQLCMELVDGQGTARTARELTGRIQ